MKILTCFLVLFCTINFGYSQTKYDNLWKEINALEEKGLPKSALEKLNEIENTAEAEKNEAQKIKVLLYKSKYLQTIEEDSQLNVVEDFKSKIETATSPTKNILEGYLANLYWQYFQQNRWRFYDRTRTAQKVDSIDFRTWDLETLFKEIDIHFQNSLNNPEILKNTSVSEYSAIIVHEKGSEDFRPTIYDLLAHNALDFYKTDENAIAKPAEKFIIKEKDYLEKAALFKDIAISTTDTTSLKFRAIRIYQELIQFHYTEKNIAALIDADIDRLDFVKNNSSIPNKDGILITTLERSANDYKSSEYSGLYNYELARIYVEQGNQYAAGTNEQNRWKIKDALEICENVIKDFPGSLAAEKCRILRNSILQSNVQIISEEYLPVDKPSKILLEYKNLEKINIQIYQVSIAQIRDFNTKNRIEDQIQFLKSLTAFKQVKGDLKNEGDYQTHRMEIVIPPLANGHYIFKASTPENDDAFGVQSLQVTDFALVEKNNKDNYLFQIINRLNGEPIFDAKVDFSYQLNGNQTFQNKSFTTDKRGEFVVPKTEDVFRNIKMLVRKNDRTAYFDDLYIYRDYYESNQNSVRFSTSVFTDRSIYRPGQTVYFKAIAFKTIDQNSEVIPNENLFAVLHDVNGQRVSELELRTNEFGSVAGEFVLPSNGLTGQFYIEITGSNKNIYAETFFSVEEYKRPKFKAEILPNSQIVKVNDTVKVEGTALSYAGSAITNAKVVYRVYRKVELPMWFYWSRPWFNSEPQEITSGNTTTDDEGKFRFDFKAIPDESVDQKNLPIFHYEVTAEVTDINGETRTAEKTINVGYHTTVVDIQVKDQISKDADSASLILKTENLNGEKIKSSGTLTIYKLEAPEFVLRKRPWQNPDYKSLSEAEYKKLFPYEAYDTEDNPNTWERGEVVLNEQITFQDSIKIALNGIKNWKSGLYLAVAEMNDSYGQMVKDEKRFNVFSPEDKKVADNQLFEIFLNKDEFSPSDKAEITLGTAADKLFVTLDIEKNHKIVETKIMELKNERKSITIPIEQNDLGGFAVLYSYSYMNDFESGAKVISVPYPATDLNIETVTFRDKLEPGVEETWEFKITGPQGDKMSSELLASMYDLSLDQFRDHEWSFDPLFKQQYYPNFQRTANRSYGTRYFRMFWENAGSEQIEPQLYDEFEWFGFSFGNFRNSIRIRGVASAVAVEEMEMDASAPSAVSNQNAVLDEVVAVGYGVRDSISKKEVETVPQEEFNDVSPRKNLEETAFFFPQLKTDVEGNISFSFTSPEALTTWKLQLLAHTKNLESKVSTLETITQKELMVIPNAPRFLREGDEIVISSKISNLSDKTLTGTATLVLIDPFTEEDITEKLLGNQISPISPFSVNASGNTETSWILTVPKNIQVVQYKVLARSGDFTDGEQNVLPVLTNRKLVTETLPMWVKTNETKSFTLDKLQNNTSTTLTNHKLSLEVTSNPAWYAVQALPYLMEYPYDSNEQIFSRIYANSIASKIANSNPKIKAVFDQWSTSDALVSNLEKNEELKSILLEQTPWVRDAQNETEQKKRIGLLFNLNKMSNELRNAELKLSNAQLDNGAWAWFKGGLPNRFITQYIVTGFGHLDKLNAKPASEISNQMVFKAMQYLDQQFVEEYDDITKYDKNADLSKDHLSYSQIHYLYMRSYFPEIQPSKKVQEIMDYYHGQIKKYWLSKSLYAKALMAMIAHINKDVITANAILKSLNETSITSDELGMYWKENVSSWFWYQAPIETQSVIIEAFSEINNDVAIVDNLKIWLLKNKQVQNWKTTKATALATYALLLKGSDWLSVTEMVDVSVGGKTINPNDIEGVAVEAGTGYYKTSWTAPEITKEMATTTMKKKGEGIAWGSLYWQYFEDLDKITSAETPLKIQKKLFKRTYSDSGEIITVLEENSELEVGDLVRVRIELRVDRQMEYIHMEDMRASGLEPVDVISTFQWQDGLGYYQSTRDASTNFFFDYLPKGNYVFEYDLRVNNAGNMSNGITTIECMYASEFSSHSEGVRISVEK